MVSAGLTFDRSGDFGWRKRIAREAGFSTQQEDKEMPHKMTRRDLLKAGAMSATAFGIGRSLGAMPSTALGAAHPAISELAGWKPGDPIGYINPNIPDFQLRSYAGERYEVTVPDTLDLAERAHVAVNGLTEPVYEPANFEVYSFFWPLSNPPSMALWCWMMPWGEDWMWRRHAIG